MQKIFWLKVLPSEATSESIVKKYIAKAAAVTAAEITGFHILKKSIDARGKQPWVLLSVRAFINEPFLPVSYIQFNFKDVSNANKTIIIIGAGPAGIFAALKLIEAGIKPIILERGKDVKARRRDLAILTRQGEINPESNYCFGEGGAGTFSDGKLYTRSHKRGDINRILNLFVHFGADEKILYESHPHIGTNKLPHIITAIRKKILDCGGVFLFEKKVVDIIIKDGQIRKVKTADGNSFEATAVILATGHSARDIFEMLYYKKILLEAKPFALGVRVEHAQTLIDSAQYHLDPTFFKTGKIHDCFLPPASYSLKYKAGNRSVFSFCMCPGGIIAPAATAPGELVVNGWSPSKRNNPYANSGIVVSVESEDWQIFSKHGPLAGMYFQQQVEQKAYKAGGGKFVAPALRLVDFCENKVSANLPRCSYLPGITSFSLQEVLPDFIYKNLQKAFIAFGKKIRGYYTNEAVVLATESRTSSPVRIPRDKHTLKHPQIHNLYPCGEGAGYAGGIMSAAMDGEKVAQIIAESIR